MICPAGKEMIIWQLSTDIVDFYGAANYVKQGQKMLQESSSISLKTLDTRPPYNRIMALNLGILSKPFVRVMTLLMCLAVSTILPQMV